jgi:threonine dehydrogenase-like Zn-dependent dehydrogenase
VWAAQLTSPGSFTAVDVLTPTAADLAPGEVLLRVVAGGICGSDIPKLCRRQPPPGHPLHEVVGEVHASSHPAHRIGARVVGWASRSDALAEVIVTDGEGLHEYDPRLDPLPAVLCQSLACVLHALDRVEVRGRSVAILGLGPIGLLFAHVARSRGARVVLGVDPVDRTDRAAQFGVDEVVVGGSAEWASALDPTGHPELVVEAAGHQPGTFADAVRAAGVEGTVLSFGIHDEPMYPLDMEAFMRKNLTLVGGVTRRRREALGAAEAYLRTHPALYTDLVTHEFDRTGVQDAFDVARRPATDRLKVLLALA